MYNNNYFGQYPNYNQNYNPPYMNYQNPMQNSVKPIMQQQVQQDLPFAEVRYGTLDEAKGYIVFPTKSVMFIDRNLGELYIKSANQMGEPTLEEFTFKKKTNKEEIKQEVVKEEKINFDDFVKVDDLKGLVKEEDFKALNNRIDKLQKLFDKIAEGEVKHGK